MCLGFFFFSFHFFLSESLWLDHNLIRSQALGARFGYLSTIDLQGNSEGYFSTHGQRYDTAPMLLTSN